jgi:hypothetical protein
MKNTLNNEQEWRSRIRKVIQETESHVLANPDLIAATSDTPPALDPAAAVGGDVNSGETSGSVNITLTKELLEKLLTWASELNSDDADDIDDAETPELDDAAPVGTPETDLSVLAESKKWKKKVSLKESYAALDEQSAWEAGQKAWENKVIDCPETLNEDRLKNAWHDGWKAKFIGEQKAEDVVDQPDTTEIPVDAGIDALGDEEGEDELNSEIASAVEKLISIAQENADTDGVVGIESFDAIVGDEENVDDVDATPDDENDDDTLAQELSDLEDTDDGSNPPA